ncbi:MAG: hypothetical protein V4597_08310 [Pseudomonadota bacterium]
MIQADLLAPPPFDPAEGSRRKAEGQALQAESLRLRPYRDRIRDYLVALAEAGEAFTSDSVYAMAEAEGDPLPAGQPMGAMFSAAAKAGLIGRVWTPSVASDRAASHRRALTVWKGAGR